MPRFRIINAPSAGIKEMLLRRADKSAQGRGEAMENCTAIAMFQATMPDCYYYADLAQKAAAVVALEINGTCPQRLSMMALFGDISAVRAAVKAIQNDKEDLD